MMVGMTTVEGSIAHALTGRDILYVGRIVDALRIQKRMNYAETRDIFINVARRIGLDFGAAEFEDLMAECDDLESGH